MLTSHRQKYNPKKPIAKINAPEVFMQAIGNIFLKNFYQNFTDRIWQESLTGKIEIKNPPPSFLGEGHHQNTLHLSLSLKSSDFFQRN